MNVMDAVCPTCGAAPGDPCLWWGPDHAGYAHTLLRAGTYTAEECDEIEENSQRARQYSQISVRIPVKRLQEVPRA